MERLPNDATTSEANLEELRERIAELTEAVAARDVFIAVAAHELRNPMTPMVGQVDLLMRGLQSGRYTPEQVEHRLGRIRLVMQHYIKRATILLDVSRINSGQFKLEPAPCDLAELVRDVAASFADAARYAGSPIGVEAPASLSGVWDRLAVEKITDNLVSNALRYGAHGPVHVCASDLGDQVRVQVRDHGPGISPEDRGRIFERFERAVAAGERRSGFGVGLWVVGQLVVAMEGTITVENAKGGGAVFDVILPRRAKTADGGR